MIRLLSLMILAVGVRAVAADTWAPWSQQQLSPDGRVQWVDGERRVKVSARREGTVWRIRVASGEDPGPSDAGVAFRAGCVELPGLPPLTFTHDGDLLRCVVVGAPGDRYYGLGENRGAWGILGSGLAVNGAECLRLPGGEPVGVPLAFVASSAGFAVKPDLQAGITVTVGGDPPQISVLCRGLSMGLHMWAGGTPAELAAADWEPVAPPPDWLLEPWVSVPAEASEERILQIAARWRAEELPAGVLVIPCVPDATPFGGPGFPDPRAMVEKLHADGWHVVVDRPWRWVPHVAASGGALGYLTPEDGEVSEEEVVSRVQVAQVALADLGVDGVLHRLETRAPKGLSEVVPGIVPRVLQGPIPLKLWQDGVSRGGVASVAFAGAGAIPPRGVFVCTTPSAGSWEDLAGDLRAVLTLGQSGAPFVARTPVTGKEREEASYVRSVQLSALLPVLWVDGAAAPWDVSPEAVDAVAEVISLRSGFFPLFQSLLREAAQTGTPVARAVSWCWPGSESSWAAASEFLLGDGVLVAPVCTPDGQQGVHVPPGDWMDLYDGSTVKGPAVVNCAATPTQLPVFLRAGAIVPQMLDPDLRLSCSLAESHRTVLEILPPFTRGESSFTWRREEGDVTLTCRRRDQEVTVRGPGGDLPPRTLLRLEVGPPESVSVDGRNLEEIGEEEVAEGDKCGYCYRKEEQVCFIWPGRQWRVVTLQEKSGQARFEDWSFPERPRASAGPMVVEVRLPALRRGAVPVLAYDLEGSSGLVLGEALGQRRWRFCIPLPSLAAPEDLTWQVVLQLEEDWSIQSRERRTRILP